MARFCRPTFRPQSHCRPSRDSLAKPGMQTLRYRKRDGMPDRLSIHAPVMVNTIGHCAGAIIFGILLHLFLLDWRRATGERSLLPSIAAGLGLLWNLGSLIGMGTAPGGE